MSGGVSVKKRKDFYFKLKVLPGIHGEKRQAGQPAFSLQYIYEYNSNLKLKISMDLKEQLVGNALFWGGCADGVNQLSEAGNKKEMLRVYWDRIDFCLAKDFPSKDFLKDNFGEVLEEMSIYIDRSLILPPQGNVVLLGKGYAVLHAEKYAVSRLYVKHDMSLTIQASDHAFVMVDVLDDAKVEVVCEGDARVVVNLYARATAGSSGDGLVKIISKNKETYDL